MEKSNANGNDVRLETDCAKRAVVVDWCIEPVERAADGDRKRLQVDCYIYTVAGDWKRLPVAEPATRDKLGQIELGEW